MTRPPSDLDAEKILAALQRRGVRFVLIGALAATIHGSPLRTDDIDLCPDRDEDNLAKLAKCLTELDTKEWDPHKGEAVARVWSAEVLKSDKLWLLVCRFGNLDLVFEPAGTGGFSDLNRTSILFEVGNVKVAVASLRDIIRSKEAAGREKDKAHLPTLQRLLDASEGR